MRKMKELWYSDTSESPSFHYNETRYYALNLHFGVLPRHTGMAVF